MSLGKNLKRERERRNWSQKYVADKLGITNTVLSNYERDYRDPDTEMLKKLAELYEITSDQLLDIEKGKNNLSESKMNAIKAIKEMPDDEADYFYGILKRLK